MWCCGFLEWIYSIYFFLWLEDLIESFGALVLAATIGLWVSYRGWNSLGRDNQLAGVYGRSEASGNDFPISTQEVKTPPLTRVLADKL